MSVARSGLAVALALLFVGILVPAGYAADLTGKYVEYEISLDSTFVSKNGTLRQEVVEDYGDGTALVKYEGEFGETKFMVEKVVNSSMIRFPYLAAVPSIVFSTVVGSFNVSLVSEFVGTEAVDFLGEDWIVSVTSFSLVVVPLNASVDFEGSLDGTLRTFGSGLVYSVEASGEADFEIAGSLMLSVQLIDTSLDPDEQVSTSSDSLSGMFDVNSVSSEGTSDDEPAGGIPLSLILVGVAALAVSVAYLVRRSRSKEETSGESGEEKPSHWVH